MATIFHDLRFALRTFVRSPGFTALTLLTLALGIGASISIFSAVNEVMFRPLPFAAPDRLAMLWESNAERGWHQVHAAPANVMDWRDRVAAFEDIAMVNEYTTDVALTGTGDPVQLTAGQVSGNAFSVLGVTPMLGRTFTFEETWADAAPTVVLRHDVWEQHFASDRSIVGKTIRLDGVAFEVIGVMGPDFRYMVNDANIWTSYFWSDQRRESVWFRQAHVVRAIGRIKPDVTFEQAQNELTRVAQQLQAEYPETNRSMDAGLTPLQRFIVGDRRTTLIILLGSVVVLQLIACANVANLLLSRSVSRRQEIAVRAALGAGRRRIVRQVFTESLLLAGLGTVFGLLVGITGLQWITSLRPPELPDLMFRLDWRVAAFTVSVSGLSAVVFGALPAIRSARLDVAGQLTDGARTGGASRRGQVATHGLVALEIGLAVMLVVGAGLMIRSLGELRRVDAGVDLANVLTFEITPPVGKYPTSVARGAFVANLLDELRGVTGVIQAGGVRRLPYQGFAWSSDFTIDSWGPDEFGVEVRHREATPGYFAAMGIPVFSGSLFHARLNPDEAVPVVVNRAFADEYFPDQNPIGRLIAYDRTPTENSYWYPIVAVVGNERMAVTEEPRPEVISHLVGDMPRTIRIVLKTTVPPLTIVPAVRETVARLDNEIPLALIRTMDDVAAEALASDRFLATLMSVFAGAALILAAVGVYGVAAQAARARTREIGIRIALGATGGTIVNSLLVKGATVALLGVGIGLAGSLAAGRLMRGLLFGIEPTDPVTLSAVVFLLSGVAVASGLGPALKATRLDPVSVLKVD